MTVQMPDRVCCDDDSSAWAKLVRPVWANTAEEYCSTMRNISSIGLGRTVTPGLQVLARRGREKDLMSDHVSRERLRRETPWQGIPSRSA